MVLHRRSRCHAGFTTAARLRSSRATWRPLRVEPATLRSVMSESARIMRLAGVYSPFIEGDAKSYEALMITYPVPLKRGHEVAAACGERWASRSISSSGHRTASGARSGGHGHPQRVNVHLFIHRVDAAATGQARSFTLVAGHVLRMRRAYLLRTHEHGKAGLMAPSARSTDMLLQGRCC
jgi:hypothetical protein